MILTNSTETFTNLGQRQKTLPAHPSHFPGPNHFRPPVWEATGDRGWPPSCATVDSSDSMRGIACGFADRDRSLRVPTALPFVHSTWGDYRARLAPASVTALRSGRP